VVRGPRLAARRAGRSLVPAEPAPSTLPVSAASFTCPPPPPSSFAPRIKGRRFNVPGLLGPGYAPEDWRDCAIAINRRGAGLGAGGAAGGVRGVELGGPWLEAHCPPLAPSARLEQIAAAPRLLLLPTARRAPPPARPARMPGCPPPTATASTRPSPAGSSASTASGGALWRAFGWRCTPAWT
jgi:hypothetical protein